MLRLYILLLGPVGLIGLCYAVAAPTTDVPSATASLPALPSDLPLRDACQAAAAEYREVLPSHWTLMVQPPFVLGSDLPAAEIERLDHETLRPTLRALTIAYFDAVAEEPITILMASSTEAFEECVEQLGYGGRSEYAGLYSRDHRRMVLNLSTGEGTLAHELTHALAHIDFPEMPEWFDEGLASLHEDSEFSDDGLVLRGIENWRGALLRQAHRRGALPPLENFVSEEFSSRHAARNYALARSLCLYLQERGRLGDFYRKCRASIAVDPTGGWSLAAVLGHEDLHGVESDFHAWIAQSDTQSASAR